MCYSFGFFRILITLAGLPIATVHAGTSFVTKEPAPMTTPSPIVTPGIIIESIPIAAFLPICTGHILGGLSVYVSPIQ